MDCACGRRSCRWGRYRYRPLASFLPPVKLGETFQPTHDLGQIDICRPDRLHARARDGGDRGAVEQAGILKGVLLLKLRDRCLGLWSADAVFVERRIGAELVERLLHQQHRRRHVLVRLGTGRNGRTVVDRDRGILRHHRMQDNSGAELGIDMARVEDVVRDELAGLGLGRSVEGRAAVEIGRVDALGVIAEAVEAFEPIQGTRDAPVLRADEVLDPQRVHGTVDERGERAAPFRNEACHALQRLAVAEIGVEIEIGFTIMAQRDEVPGHAGQPLDLLIGRLAVDGLACRRVGLAKACGPDLEIGPVRLIPALQTLV